ncbi:hypothetical protein [Nocardia terpenica]|nr:hypothetical protein [Nocardia terpenica]
MLSRRVDSPPRTGKRLRVLGGLLSMREAVAAALEPGDSVK